MKRLVYLFLFAIAISACKKTTTDTKCYVCEMTYANGVSADKQYPCTEDIEKWKSERKDNYGRPMQATCKEL